jgi:hypothetical protein
LSRLTPSEIIRLLFEAPNVVNDDPSRKEMRRKRRELSRSWNVKGKSKGDRQGTRRAIEDVVRKDRVYNPDRARVAVHDYVSITRSMKPSLILDGLYPERRIPGRWKPIVQRERGGKPHQISLKGFSFLENPEATLIALREIAKIESSHISAQLNFDDTACLDVAPFMALMECWPEMVPIFEGGHMDLPMQKVLAATTISDAMGIGLGGVTDFEDVWAFPLTRRRKPGTTRSKKRFVDVPTRDTATSRFCNAMDDWLGRPDIGLELSASGVNKLMSLLGEVLENAERHSDGERRDGAWSVSGFLAKRPKQTQSTEGLPAEISLYHANIGILSVGDTFSQSLERAHPNQLDNISDYIERVRADGATQSDDTLRTVCALQDTVTCVKEADEASRGGYGLMDILDFVSALGQSEDAELLPKVTIISGKSCIQLRGDYITGRKNETSEGSPRVQWFNKENSAKVAPDSEHVYDLGVSFPGTVISISFCLDPRYLSRAFSDA